MSKPLTPPTHCPFCGSLLRVVQAIAGTFYEVACEACDRTAVISVDDHVVLPSLT